MEFGGGSPSLYRVLGVCSYSSDEEIRRAYLKLAMQWHPDKWARNPALLGEAKQKFQKIQEAYSVLSDRKRRRLYDAGLYGPDIEEEDELEGFSDFLQEMVSLINDARKEKKFTVQRSCKACSGIWLVDLGFPNTILKILKNLCVNHSGSVAR